jgi:glutathione S-transferase
MKSNSETGHAPTMTQTSKPQFQSQVYDTQLKGEPKPMLVIEKILSEQGPYLGGEVFGVSDVAVASYLLFVPQFFPRINLAKWPAISAYMLRCAQVCEFAIRGLGVFKFAIWGSAVQGSGAV